MASSKRLKVTKQSASSVWIDQGLIEAAKQNRSGHRDATAISVAYRLRASGLVTLRWDDIDLTPPKARASSRPTCLSFDARGEMSSRLWS